MLSNNSNNLLLPWECNDQSIIKAHEYDPLKYYFMVTIKNNTSPKKQYTEPNRICLQVNRLLLKGFKHIKSAFELDSKGQLHLHMVCYHDKNINRVNNSKNLKQFEPTFVHDIKQIEDFRHYMYAINYLNPSLNQSVLTKYKLDFGPKDSTESPEDLFKSVNQPNQVIDDIDFLD